MMPLLLLCLRMYAHADADVVAGHSGQWRLCSPILLCWAYAKALGAYVRLKDTRCPGTKAICNPQGPRTLWRCL